MVGGHTRGFSQMGGRIAPAPALPPDEQLRRDAVRVCLDAWTEFSRRHMSGLLPASHVKKKHALFKVTMRVPVLPRMNLTIDVGITKTTAADDEEKLRSILDGLRRALLTGPMSCWRVEVILKGVPTGRLAAAVPADYGYAAQPAQRLWHLDSPLATPNMRGTLNDKKIASQWYVELLESGPRVESRSMKTQERDRLRVVPTDVPDEGGYTLRAYTVEFTTPNIEWHSANRAGVLHAFQDIIQHHDSLLPGKKITGWITTRERAQKGPAK